MNIEAQSRALRRLAIELVGNDAMADDLTQDAWVDALKNPPAAGRPAGPWLRTLLRNRRVTNLRAHARRVRREQAVPAPTPAPSAEQIQVARDLLEHLAALPGADRNLLTMRYWEARTLQECADRLGMSASAVRSRHARALVKLRERLDERTGGREAWLAALAPWLEVPVPATATATAPALSLASLSAGGVLAGASLWLMSALNPGCSTALEAEEANEPAGDSVVRQAEASLDSTAEDDTVVARTGHKAAVGREVDFDAEKHPCANPMSPDDFPELKAILDKGEKPTFDQLMAIQHACRKKHGPPTAYRARQANPDGSVHPLLSSTMSWQHIWPAMRECYTASEPARILLSLSFWLHEDGSMTVEDIKTHRSEGLDKDQIACVENSLLVAEVDLRNGDPTKMDLPEYTVLEIPRMIEVELKNATTTTIGAGREPASLLQFVDRAAFLEQVQRCSSEPMGATLHWDPHTGEFLDVEADASLAAETGACLTKLLDEQVKSPALRFFPDTDADTYQHCTFHGTDRSCAAKPAFRVVDR